MTYDLWRHCMQDGRNTLAEYNRRNDLNIYIEKTLSLQDMDHLGSCSQLYNNRINLKVVIQALPKETNPG